LANIALLKKYPGKITLIDKTTKLIAINKKQKLTLTGKKESTVSIFPASTSSPRVKTMGLKYNLDNQKLMFPTQGISNVMQKNLAQICIDNGLLLVCANIETSLETRTI
jgi:thiamine pyrophosphokinase